MANNCARNEEETARGFFFRFPRTTSVPVKVNLKQGFLSFCQKKDGGREWWLLLSCFIIRTAKRPPYNKGEALGLEVETFNSELLLSSKKELRLLVRWGREILTWHAAAFKSTSVTDKSKRRKHDKRNQLKTRTHDKWSASPLLTSDIFI